MLAGIDEHGLRKNPLRTEGQTDMEVEIVVKIDMVRFFD